VTAPAVPGPAVYGMRTHTPSRYLEAVP
jgi:hypothetical protein